MSTIHVLPYPEEDGPHTGGWSGSDASHERALDEASSGKLGYRLASVLELVDYCGKRGTTVADVRHELSLHHGQASSALTILHKQGRITRLEDRRDRCHIYVTPEYVAGRETQAPGQNRAKTRDPESEAEVVKKAAVVVLQDLHDQILKIGRVRAAHYPMCWKDHTECVLEEALVLVRAL